MAITVLIADDENDIRDIIRITLESKGISVRTAGNGHQALESVDDGLPDIIILDVNMPDVSGFDVLKKLKGQPHTQHIPVIMLTANDAVEQIARGWRLGADFYWTKPFKASQLADLVGHIAEVEAV